LRAQVESEAAKLKELKSEVPWVGDADPLLKKKIEDRSKALQAAEGDLQRAIQDRENLLAQRRGLAPVFSKPAFDEARSLFWKRQGHHKEISVWMWSMDIIFGATRSDSLAEAIIVIVARLAWNLSFGIIFGLIDFAIRLPFYIAEYQLYTFNEPVPDYHNEPVPDYHASSESPNDYVDNEQSGSNDNQIISRIEPIPIEGPSKISGYLDAILFYFLVILGAWRQYWFVTLRVGSSFWNSCCYWILYSTTTPATRSANI